MERIDSPAALDEEATFKRQQNALNEIRQIVEDANNRLSFDRPNFAERYVQGNINLAFDFCVRGHGHKNRAFIERIPDGVSSQLQGALDKDRCPVDARMNLWAKQAEANSRTLTPYRDDILVFVGDIECVERPEKVIPSRVCLESTDHVDGIRVELLYFSRDLGFKYLSVFPKGEIDARRVRRSVGLGQPASQLVETDSEAVNCVGSNQTDFVRDGAAQLDLDVFADSVVVFLFEHSIGFGFKEGTDSALQVTDMLFGPFGL